MASWVNLTDTQLDPDAPLTSNLAYAWRDNPIAIAEGASGAARIELGALARVAVGTTTRHSSTKTASPRSWEFPLIQGGAIRVTISSMVVGDSMTIARVRAGSSSNIHSQSGTAGNGDFTVNVLPGDKVVVTITGSDGANRTVAIKTGAVDIFPVGGDFFGNYTANTLT